MKGNIDARIILNKKRGKAKSTIVAKWRQRDTSSSVKTFDARHILESRRKPNNINSRNKILPKFHQATVNSYVKNHVPKFPGKHVEVSSDGNLFITSQTKIKNHARAYTSFPMDVTVKKESKEVQSKKILRKPFDELEHMSLEDLPDVKSLPSGLISSKLNSRSRSPQSSSAALNNLYSVSETRFKVFVTNLHPSVSEQDVIELFSHVGVIKSAELLQPGVAIVEFFSLEDALQACDTYHNRLLDGQAMNCSIQPNSLSRKASISQRLGGRVLSTTIPPKMSPPYIPSSTYNQRNVQFTVKLP